MFSDMKVYVGCCLTGAPVEFIDRIDSLKAELAKIAEVVGFLGLTKGTCRDVWDWDIERCVKSSDLMVAVCDYPSIGLGVEIGVRVMLEKPIIAVAHADQKVTRLIQDPGKSGYQFHRYRNLNTEVIRLVRTQLEAIEALNSKEQGQLVFG